MEDHQLCLQELQLFLLDYMKYFDVFDHVLAVNGLTPDEAENVRAQRGDREQMRELLQVLRRKDIHVFNAFLEGAKTNCRHVLKALDEKMEEIKKRPKGIDTQATKGRSYSYIYSISSYLFRSA